MLLCSVCPAPGSCCKHFNLLLGETHAFTTWKDEGIAAAIAEVSARGLPYTVDEICNEYVAEGGRVYVSWWFSCDKVTPEGRCSIYNERPNVCRIFLPGTNELCKPFYREAVN